ncbi:hypothetical protein [Chitinophaga sp. 212800010-3]|uniref:HYC_CC_PP family protein n=1 Tax=unclassified Chitinophaga TaxID=2619133 RepID=UPI002DEB686B|nr:Secreted protein [Chitinophaga sp. 212800010-3]
MKRILAIFFALLYTTLTSGVAVNVHYCMGKLAGIEWQETPDGFCQKCKKPAKGMDCCKNEFKFCKVTESHQAAKTLQPNFSLYQADLQLPVRELPTPVIAVTDAPIGGYPHDPPDISDTPIFLKNCTFLI